MNDKKQMYGDVITALRKMAKDLDYDKTCACDGCQQQDMLITKLNELADWIVYSNKCIENEDDSFLEP